MTIQIEVLQHPQGSQDSPISTVVRVQKVLRIGRCGLLIRPLTDDKGEGAASRQGKSRLPEKAAIRSSPPLLDPPPCPPSPPPPLPLFLALSLPSGLPCYRIKPFRTRGGRLGPHITQELQNMAAQLTSRRNSLAQRTCPRTVLPQQQFGANPVAYAPLTV